MSANGCHGNIPIARSGAPSFAPHQKTSRSAAGTNCVNEENRNRSDESTGAKMSCRRVEQTKDGVVEMKEVRSEFVIVDISDQLRVIGWAAFPHA
jgi:hypothetical protein